MGAISFNFSPIQKTKVKSSTTRTYVKKESTVSGVVFIDTDATYYVETEKGEKYRVNPLSFPCKGKDYIWTFKDDTGSHLLCIIRTNEYKSERGYKYKPFAPGSFVKGHLVKVSSETSEIVINETSFGILTEQGHIARKFFIENYEEIKENYERVYGYS